MTKVGRLFEEEKFAAIKEEKTKDRKDTAHDMMMDGENIEKVRKYSKLPDKELASVLRELPIEIQAKYKMLKV